MRKSAPFTMTTRRSTDDICSSDCPAGIPPVTQFPNFTGNGFAVYNQFTAHLGNPQSEDCLALNVWTKSVCEDDTSKKPVFVFFHGGRFTIPGPHSPFYDGQYLADAQDVVVVTISYRLGMFGFSGAPGLEQNTGLRDQRLAVEWVRDNIAGFGGDSDRIIIFGQSAGGSSVDYWAYAYQMDPIVAGLISQSGTALSYRPNTPEYSQSLFYNVSGTLGCGGNTTDSASVIACVRSKNFTQILAAARIVPALPSPALAQAAFHPTVDDTIVFANYTALGEAGHFARIPYLAGNGNYEAGFYRVGAFNANKTLSPEAWQLFNQRAFTCPTKYANDFRVQHNVPTWRYRYMADWENLRLYGAWGGYPDSGSYHGSDLTMLFGTAYDVTGQNNTCQEELTSRYIQGAWAAFGRSPTTGLDSYGWPSYSANTSSLVRLGNDNQAIPSFVSPSLYDNVCPPVDVNDPLPGRGAF
jgi:carboxylesterase type B